MRRLRVLEKFDVLLSTFLMACCLACCLANPLRLAGLPQAQTESALILPVPHQPTEVGPVKAEKVKRGAVQANKALAGLTGTVIRTIVVEARTRAVRALVGWTGGRGQQGTSNKRTASQPRAAGDGQQPWDNALTEKCEPVQFAIPGFRSKLPVLNISSCSCSDTLPLGKGDGDWLCKIQKR